jgi:nitroimidazol reductase NimA-like FMN-containing flavoprotein (pyridoxamine 5'-phosphate oxidase superfamily)
MTVARLRVRQLPVVTLSREGDMRSRNPAVPELGALSESEAKRVLSRNHVGRIAFSFHDRVDVCPIGYVFRDGWLFGRTSPAEKVVTERNNQPVAFEVDEVSNQLNWTSVVVQGALYELDEDGSEFHRRARDFAIRLLRSVDPAALTSDDPAPSRTEVFGIAIRSISGRRCRTSSRFEMAERIDQPA